jgi:hypothetical protein
MCYCWSEVAQTDLILLDQLLGNEPFMLLGYVSLYAENPKSI